MRAIEAMEGTVSVLTERSRVERELGEQLAALEAALSTHLELRKRKHSVGKIARMLESALDCSSDPTWATDAQGRCFLWNTAASRAWGWRREELLGQHLHSLVSAVAPVPNDSCEASVDGFAAEPHAVDEGHYVRMTRTLRDAAGRSIATLGIARSVVEASPETDAELRELAATARASQAMLAVASHELASPVSALRVLIANTRRAAASGRECPEWLSDRVKMAEQQVERMAHKLDVLLDVSRIKAGKLVLQPEPFDLVELAQEIVGRHQEQALGVGCRLTLHSPTRLVGTWDRVRMDQVITNLIGNAIKFGRNAPVDVTIARSDGFVRLEVRDHGVGIPLIDQKRIFEPFERADRQRCAGLGLGLWIVREIVSAHQGAISLSSVVGDGTSFTVVLPEE